MVDKNALARAFAPGKDLERERFRSGRKAAQGIADGEALPEVVLPLPEVDLILVIVYPS